ncbi:unnamed protein product [Pleuronectes platessa]|uniref:Uncharacterized protein n=1 Tax=Pleuronectes platessa TaxID=8262 RepID=A0A9N7VJH7_PLEPL|nr:unnamed protein product [Pleuronectes platessa]
MPAALSSSSLSLFCTTAEINSLKDYWGAVSQGNQRVVSNLCCHLAVSYVKEIQSALLRFRQLLKAPGYPAIEPQKKAGRPEEAILKDKASRVLSRQGQA